MRWKLGLVEVPTLRNKALDLQEQLQRVALHQDGR